MEEKAKEFADYIAENIIGITKPVLTQVKKQPVTWVYR